MEILEALWYGQICPVSQADYRSEEYRKLVALLEHSEKKLLDTMGTQQQEDLQRIKDLVEEMERITEYAAFAKGFRLAVQLMTACA